MADKILKEIPKNKSETIVISEKEFRGNQYIDLRVFYKDDNEELKPTKKGIMIKKDLLPEIRETINNIE
ncbi:MAG: transcriptional coactivator p15/PC4 family protein [Candidatus Aureabacteria bacterium]|nr:transcriptional coactivator p15/PC4 family protein [Candidatus Auribacterota bacterium]